MQKNPILNSKREMLVEKIRSEVINDLILNRSERIRKYASDKDPAIRKIVHLVILRLYRDMKPYFGENILKSLTILLNDKDEKIKQAAQLALAEINKKNKSN